LAAKCESTRKEKKEKAEKKKSATQLFLGKLRDLGRHN
jgi:hypothetical protein